MAKKVQNIETNGYNSKTNKNNVKINSLCGRYFNCLQKSGIQEGSHFF